MEMPLPRREVVRPADRTALVAALALAIAVAVLLPRSAYAQDAADETVGALPPAGGLDITVPEAAASLYSLSLGDEGVDVFLEGTWRSRLTGGTGLRIQRGAPVEFPTLFPGLPPTGFESVPDLSFSVWFAERYFLQTQLQGSFDSFLFLAGYEGRDDELLRHLYVGNTPLSFPAYPFLAVGEVPDALALDVELGTASSSHRLLARFEQAQSREQVFIDDHEVIESRLLPTAFLRRQFFFLPDAGVSAVTVLVEDADGPLQGGGRSYRVAGAAEVAVDAGAGRVSFATPVAGRVLARWTVGGTPWQNAGIRVDALPDPAAQDPDANPANFVPASADTVDVGGNTYLVLSDPAAELVYELELANTFALPHGAAPDAALVTVEAVVRGSEEPTTSLQWDDSNVRFAVDPEAGVVVAYHDGAFRGSFRNIYPFAQREQQAEGLLIGRDTLDPHSIRFELLVRERVPVTGLQIEPGAVPGSVRVTRNGAPESRFVVNYETGQVTLQAPALASDVIRIRYQLPAPGAQGGDLTLAWGNTIGFGPLAQVDVAAGLRWNPVDGAFTTTPNEHTGALVGSVGIRGERTGDVGSVSYEAAFGVALSNPNTTGIRRLLGMEGEGVLVPLSEEVVYPGAPGARAVNQRGRLLYRDYRRYTLLQGAVLQPWDTPDWPPAEQVFAYEDLSKPGPYLVAGSAAGASTGQSLVLHYQLDADQHWVAAQVPPIPGAGLADLSATTAVTVSYRVVDAGGGDQVDIDLELGALAEDLDSDGKLDRELTAGAVGFVFDPADANGAALLVGGGPRGTGNARLDSEDVDGNGSLDPLTGATVPVSVAAGVVGSHSTWQTVTVPLTAAQRATLERTRAVRLVVTADGAAASGRLLVDRIELAGGSFSVTSDGTATAADLREDDSPYTTAPVALDTAFPEVTDTFHSQGETQRVAELHWTGATTWQAVRFLPAGTGAARYRRISYYVRGTPSVPLDFALEDGAGRGIRWRLDGYGTAWRRIDVAPVDGTVTATMANGAVQSAGTVTSVSSDYGTLVELNVTASGLAGGDMTGTVQLDELHLAAPDLELGVAFAGQLSYDHAGTLLAAGGTPLVADLTVREQVYVEGAGFSPLDGSTGGAGSVGGGGPPASAAGTAQSLTELEAKVLFTHTRITVNAETAIGAAAAPAATADTALTVGHEVSLPWLPGRLGFPLAVSDAFTLSSRYGSRALERANTARLAADGIGHAVLEGQVGVTGELLSQQWHSELSWQAWQPFAADADLLFKRYSDAPPALAGDYAQAWADSLALLLPASGPDDTERSGALTATLAWAASPFGVRLHGELGYRASAFYQPTPEHHATTLLQLSTPIELGAGVVTIEPGYRRRGSATIGYAGTGGFDGDLQRLTASVAAQPFLLGFPPVVELLVDSYVDDFAAAVSGAGMAAEYAPELFVAARRAFGSRLLDLLVPATADFSLRRVMHQNDGGTDARTELTADVTTTAINLFGSRSARPLFRFYELDELTARYRYERNTGLDGTLISDALLLEHGGNFHIRDRTSFALTNRAELATPETAAAVVGLVLGRELTDTVIGTLEWSLSPEGGVGLPLFPGIHDTDGRIDHAEDLELALRFGQPGRRPVSVVLRHTTEVVLPSFGSLAGELAFGVEVEEVSDAAGNSVTAVDLGSSATLTLTVDL